MTNNYINRKINERLNYYRLLKLALIRNYQSIQACDKDRVEFKNKEMCKSIKKFS